MEEIGHGYGDGDGQNLQIRTTNGGYWVKSDLAVNTLLGKQFKKVEHKEKMYIHEYWYEEAKNYTYKRTVRTTLPWLSYVNCDNDEDFKLIKTTEIEE